MTLLEKIEKFDIESKSAEKNYKQWGTTREEHQSRMLAFIHTKMQEQQKSKQSKDSQG